MDTHQAIQIFHAIYLVNDRGEHPSSVYSQVSAADMSKSGRWIFNPEVALSLNLDPGDARKLDLLHYAHALQKYGEIRAFRLALSLHAGRNWTRARSRLLRKRFLSHDRAV